MPLKRDPSGRYNYGQSDVLINVAMCHTGSDLMAGKTDCIKKAVQKKKKIAESYQLTACSNPPLNL